MSEPKSISPPESLEQLAVGVVLGGRYSLKDRVPRWIAERRFRARELESGDFVAVLIWSAETPWFGELVDLLEALPEPIHREAGIRQGFGIVVTNWFDGMRGLRGEATSADEARRLIQESLPSAKRSLLPPRRQRVLTSPATAESEGSREPVRERSAILPEKSMAVRPNPLMEWVGLAIAVGVAAVVIGFTLQMGRALSSPIVIERKIPVKVPASASMPLTVDSQLQAAILLRKNGNATSALKILLNLRAQNPDDFRISTEINDLLELLQADLPALKAGLRPPLRRAIEQAAAEGDVGAVRLMEQMADSALVPTNSPEPLPIR